MEPARIPTNPPIKQNTKVLKAIEFLETLRILSTINKNIAIIVGGGHIFGFDEKNKKTGKTLPNLLSKMKNVKNVNYSTL